MTHKFLDKILVEKQRKSEYSEDSMNKIFKKQQVKFANSKQMLKSSNINNIIDANIKRIKKQFEKQENQSNQLEKVQENSKKSQHTYSLPDFDDNMMKSRLFKSQSNFKNQKNSIKIMASSSVHHNNNNFNFNENKKYKKKMSLSIYGDKNVFALSKGSSQNQIKQDTKNSQKSILVTENNEFINLPVLKSQNIIDQQCSGSFNNNNNNNIILSEPSQVIDLQNYENKLVKSNSNICTNDQEENSQLLHLSESQSIHVPYQQNLQRNNSNQQDENYQYSYEQQNVGKQNGIENNDVEKDLEQDQCKTQNFNKKKRKNLSFQIFHELNKPIPYNVKMPLEQKLKNLNQMNEQFQKKKKLINEQIENRLKKVNNDLIINQNAAIKDLQKNEPYINKRKKMRYKVAQDYQIFERQKNHQIINAKLKQASNQQTYKENPQMLQSQQYAKFYL
ncbi:hypothetical protein PPERSA_09356 [Pseudocohnilembus persalinus]|uniref:Uncharacterized protein n=1 Tax=Pseudocohnilembus persalinus TaxID=266149 RepID=A0A0V0QY22_PSEPJ|nr:hypothetical protein PPERSA_09356 [Pseudocohnilembus persalinus]|eukprot:KRX07142.1 hypothetical protein PPERSA_09356 [Pseudocohnilembus persalinus]